MYILVCILYLQMNQARRPIVRKLDPAKHYVFYARQHRPDRVIKVMCGVGNMMRWDSVRFQIEEQMGLHRGKKQNQVVVGRYKHEPEGWFEDNDVITPQTILRVKCVPYYWQFDYDPYRPRSAPQYGKAYYPPTILAQYQQAGIDISSLN